MTLLRPKESEKPARRDLPVLESDPALGLTAAQAAERVQAGWANVEVAPPTRTVGQIVRSNLLTYFNLIFLLLAISILMPIYANIENRTGIDLYGSYILAAGTFIGMIVVIISLILKIKNNY